MTEYACINCEDTGYEWDSAQPCDLCAKGKEKQYEQDNRELQYLIKRTKLIRARIKRHEDSKGV